MPKIATERLFGASLALCSAVPLWAQSAAPAKPVLTETVDVTTTEPLPLDAGDRSVRLLDAASTEPAFNSVADMLRQDPSVDIEARGGNGVQSDLSIRGTTFEQTLVLVNGFRVNDPETGHLNLDLPVPLESISRVDVLHGSGSTFYGSDAMGGAVNLLTNRPAATQVLLRTGFGSYGAEEQHLRADAVGRKVAEQVSGSRDVSDGFMPDRGYHENAVSSETWRGGAKDGTDILLAASDRPYGANQFYGPYDSWERTKAWFASAQQRLGARTAASFGYLRHTDLFVLFDGQPAIYENNHATTSWEGAVRRADPVPQRFAGGGSFSYGLEANGDGIRSSSLGQHGRNGGAGYANLSLPAVGRFSASVGAREEVFAGSSVFSPSVAVAARVKGNWRVRGAVGHGFRLPTYVDLDYSDPTTIGNPNLKPESDWSYEGGVDWTHGGNLRFKATGFRLEQHNTIDYSKTSLAAKWQATNVDHLNLTGAETSLKCQARWLGQVELGYTAIRAAAPPTGLISEYAYNYAAQNAIFSWRRGVLGQWQTGTEVRVVQRTGQTAYPLWNVEASRQRGSVRPYLRGLNLANTGYDEIAGVRLEGRTMMGGVTWVWSRSGK